MTSQRRTDSPAGGRQTDLPALIPRRQTGTAADVKRVELRDFIKHHRLAIDASLLALGPYRRTIARIGRPITQQEVAEAVGVSRVWYATLESGAPIRASTELLVKLSETLMLHDAERELFFNLAVPELRHTANGSIRLDSIEQSFFFFQAFIKRIWRTSSSGEAVTVAGEELTKWFDDACSIVVYNRLESPSVERRAVVETRVAMQNEFWPRRRAALTWTCVREHRGLWAALDASGAGLKRMRDDGHAYIAHPRLEPTVCESTDFIHASVRTEHAVVGAYAEHIPGRGYSGNDRQIIGNMTEFLCFAIAKSM